MKACVFYIDIETLHCCHITISTSKLLTTRHTFMYQLASSRISTDGEIYHQDYLFFNVFNHRSTNFWRKFKNKSLINHEAFSENCIFQKVVSFLKINSLSYKSLLKLIKKEWSFSKSTCFLKIFMFFRKRRF